MTIRVLASGALGKMGREVCAAVGAAADMELCGGADTAATEGQTCGEGAPLYSDLATAIEATSPDVVVDFTAPASAEGNVRTVLSAGVHCVLGTTGLSEERLAAIHAESATGGANLFCAPNFTTGAVLMMLFAEEAAKYFGDAEVIELHHDGKKDAPSGTAASTARKIAAARTEKSNAPGRETELEGMEGARGALVDGVPVHSVRTAGHVACQEVIFGSPGQTLTIRHDSTLRSSYMPGVLMAIRAVGDIDGVLVGLENLMQ